jgi:hypothetical protein
MKRETGPSASASDAKRPRLVGVAEPTTFADDLQNMAPVATKASAWKRQPVGTLDPRERDLAFQWIDIDMYDGAPLTTNPKAGEPVPGLVANANGTSNQNAAIIRLYGVTEEGNSVMMHVHGVLPYFYVVCPDTFNDAHCGDVRKALEAVLAQRDRDGSDVTRVVGIQVVNDKMSIYGYQFDRAIKLWKVYLSMPSYVPKLRTVLESGLTLPGNVPSLAAPCTLFIMTCERSLNKCMQAVSSARTRRTRATCRSFCAS